MKRTIISTRLLPKTDRAADELLLTGDTVGEDPCVTAATDSMVEDATWVYLKLEDAVAEIIDNKDDIPVDEWAARIRAAVERGIEKGRKAREEDGRL